MKVFLLGAAGYPLLELLYRGRSHYSMALAGGISALLINHVRRIRVRLLYKTLMCGLGVTGIEYICGKVWNRGYSVWDYRHLPLNFQGQVCAGYTFLWCVLSAGAMKALDGWDRYKGADR